MSQLNPDKPTYNAKFFSRKFKAIPEEMWLVFDLGAPGGPRCALGHCLPIGDESIALTNVCRGLRRNILSINNYPSAMFPQPTPKLRVVAAMEKAKEMGF